MRTSKILCRTAIAALLVSLATPALADRGYHGGGWGGRHGGGWGHHGGYGHRYHGGGGSSDGWWIGGALALVATGLVLAAANNDRSDYPPSGSYSYTQPSYAQPESGFYYESPPPMAYSVPDGSYTQPVPVPQAQAPAPVYTPPPVQQQQYQQPQYQQPRQPAAAPRTVSNAPDQYQCQRYAVNYSGYDPASPSAWSTGVGVDSYNRALQSCLAGGQPG